MYRQVTAAIHNEEHLAMVGGGFFSMFIVNALMAMLVAAAAVGIVLWIMEPWDKLGRKIIRTLGSGSTPPREADKARYAMELLDKIKAE
jgi:hypothetical protein